MPLQVNIFLLLFGGLQGVLFTLFLVRKKLYRHGHIFLLLYFAVLLLQITLKVMSKAWLMHNWSQLYQLSYQLPFLYGPLIYLFVRKATGQQTFSITDTFHIIPLVAGFYLPGEVRLILQLTSLGIYHFLAWQHVPAQSWVRKFILASLLVGAAIALTIYFMYVYFPALN